MSKQSKKNVADKTRTYPQMVKSLLIATGLTVTWCQIATSSEEALNLTIPERGITSAISARQWLEQWEQLAAEKSPKVQKNWGGKFYWTQAWMAGFLSGNGVIGVIDHGEPHDNTITVCHKKLFLPTGQNWKIGPELGDILPEYQKMIVEKGYDEAERWRLRKSWDRGYKGTQEEAFHMGFQLKIKTPPQGEVRNYLRTCDFTTNELAYQWNGDDGKHVRRMFVSRPDNAVVLSLKVSEPGGLNCIIHVPSLAEQLKQERWGALKKDSTLIDQTITASDGMIVLDNRYTKPSRGLAPAAIGGYATVVQVLPKGGTIRTEGYDVHVEGADEALVLMKLETYAVDEKSVRDIYVRMKQQIEALARKGYDTLLAAHAKQHGELFNRVKLDIGGAPHRNMPIEDLLDQALALYEISPALFENKEVTWQRIRRNQLNLNEYQIPPALLEKMYDASRYLFICSGVGGELPPNVQGIWNEGFHARWQGGYCFDTNVQLDIASALSANMAEGMHSLFDAVENVWLPGWRHNAHQIWGARGVQCHTRGAISGVNLVMAHYFMGGAAWIAHFYYDYWLYTGDLDFLQNQAVPLMKEVALFYEDILKTAPLDDNGRYVFVPGFSPEAKGVNATFEIAVAKEVLHNLIQVAEVIAIDKADVARWQAMLDKMPPYLIDDEDGSLKEFAVADTEERHTYRHSSHLYPVRWSHELSAERTPELWEAAKVAVTQRMKNVEMDQSWVHTWAKLGLSAASLGMGDTAYACIRRYVWERYMLPNLTMSHGAFYETFAFDGNGALPEIVNRMLLHSWDGVLYPLPALSKFMPQGSIAGIKARGNFEVDLEWRDSKLRRLVIHSGSGTPARINYPGICSFTVTRDGKSVEVRRKGTHAIEFDTQAEGVYQLVAVADAVHMGFVTRDGNRLMLNGKEYRAIGVNLPHLHSGYNGTWPHWREMYGTRERMRAAIVTAIEDAASHQIAFFRFGAMPGYPQVKAELYDNDPKSYWQQMDEVLDLCRKHGIRVIPVLGVNRWPLFAKMLGEPEPAVLDTESKSYRMIHSYVVDFVNRYKDDPIILAWSLSNEAFLRADVDPTRDRQKPVPDETMTFDMLLQVYAHWTDIIRKLDPNHLVTSGDSGVRQESRSRRRSVAAALETGTWPPTLQLRPNTITEYNADLIESQQSVDVASIHAYIRRPGDADRLVLAEKIGSIEFQRQRIQALRQAGMPVLVGEFAQESPYFREDPTAQAGVTALDVFEEEGVSLIGIWVWHFRWQDEDYRDGGSNDRMWNIANGTSHPVLMRMIAEFNAKYAGM